MKKKYSNEYIIERLQEFANILNKIPTKSDFNKYNWKPTVDIYYERFGNYTNACVIAGLKDKPLTDEEKINIAINELVNLANKLNRCPKVCEYESIIHKGFSRRTLEKKLKLKYNDICRKFISQYNINSHKGDVTKENIIELILDISKQIGRTPLFKELKKYNCTYSMSVFYRVFGNMTYNQIIESIGLTPSGSTTMRKTKEKLLDEFLNYFKENKTIPSYHNNNLNISSLSTYCKHFGSIRNVCDILNIDYDLYVNIGGYGIKTYDNNGVICKSIAEKDITNYFINNNINYQKEYRYSSLINNDLRRFDWKIEIDNKVYYVEYFGMYDRNAHNKICKKYTQKAKKKIKDLYRFGYTNNCIFIFPNNLKNKTLDEIFKPYINNNINS